MVLRELGIEMLIPLPTCEFGRIRGQIDKWEMKLGQSGVAAPPQSTALSG